MEQIQRCRSNVTEKNESHFSCNSAEYWEKSCRLQVRAFILLDRWWMWHFAHEHSFLGISDTRSRHHRRWSKHSHYRSNPREREKHDKFSRFINSIRCKIARTGFETNLYPIAIAHGDPHGQCYWRNACTESVEQRQTQTLAVLASRRTGKTGEAPKWKTTCKRTRPLVMRGIKMWKGWKQHWHPTFVKPSGALRFFLFLSMKWM